MNDVKSHSMLLSIKIPELSIGRRQLFSGFSLIINEGEKVALIGRNGTGKTTLFRILDGEADFDGELIRKKGTSIAFTMQEHHSVGNILVLDYILQAIPDYNRLHEIINDPHKHREHADATRRFASLGYYKLRKQIINQLTAYQIPESRYLDPLSSLSGGEKRYVEMVKVMFSQADLLCMDEPTNHMDYYGKAVFIDWLKSTRQAVLIITHDRDVLQVVNRIVELRDKKLESYSGNYDTYLKRNSDTITVRITQHEKGLRRLELLQNNIESARAKKAINPQAKQKELRLMKEYDDLQNRLEKPSFWIDDESSSLLKAKEYEQYQKYKDSNIKISEKDDRGGYHDRLLDIADLSLGYEHPLFSKLSFSTFSDSRILIKGRNGAGKTSLIKTILAIVAGITPTAMIYAGGITVDDAPKIGVYEQELNLAYMDMTVGEVIMKMYAEKEVYLRDQQLYQVMSNYLFDPVSDRSQRLGSLSGGEKARIQIMGMFVNSPDLLILDEPTNHLDLPSIEELERALIDYKGAILYVSHDSYFNAKLAEQVVDLGQSLSFETAE